MIRPDPARCSPLPPRSDRAPAASGLRRARPRSRRSRRNDHPDATHHPCCRSNPLTLGRPISGAGVPNTPLPPATSVQLAPPSSERQTKSDSPLRPVPPVASAVSPSTATAVTVPVVEGCSLSVHCKPSRDRQIVARVESSALGCAPASRSASPFDTSASKDARASSPAASLGTSDQPCCVMLPVGSVAVADGALRAEATAEHRPGHEREEHDDCSSDGSTPHGPTSVDGRFTASTHHRCVALPGSEVVGVHLDDFGVTRTAARVLGRLGQLPAELVGFLAGHHDQRLAHPHELGRHERSVYGDPPPYGFT